LFQRFDVQEILMGYIIKTWKYGWRTYFGWRQESTPIEKVLLCFVFAFFTGVSAQIVIRLPFTPVPVTGQVFAVLLSGIFLGRYAGLSQIFYLAGGTVIPWFHGASFLSIGVTTGYIFGFILAAWIVGYCVEKHQDKGFWLVAGSMMAGIFVIHLFGVMWLCTITKLSIIKGIMLGTVPFIFLDIMKAVIAIAIAKTVIPYNFDKI